MSRIKSSPRPSNISESKQRAAKIRIVLLISFLAIFGTLIGSYGHAALSTNLLISGEASVPKKVNNFWSEYMQDVTPEECIAVDAGASARLKDKRDGQEYWITKTYGDYCLMTQDLRLTLTTEGLTSELSDLNLNPDGKPTANHNVSTGANGETIIAWDATAKSSKPSNTIPEGSAINTGTSTYTTYSWDLGKYVVKDPLLQSQCTSTPSGLRGCLNYFINVEGYSPTLSYDKTGKTYDEASKTYDAHYLIGFYYQFPAATAGSTYYWKSSSGATTPDKGYFYRTFSSICPKGWSLDSKPVTPRSNGSAGYDLFYNEIQQQYLERGLSFPLWTAPTYITRGGRLSGRQLIYAGGSMTSYWMSSVLYNLNKETRYLFHEFLNPDGSNNIERYSDYHPYYGHRIRCVLRMERSS